MDGGQEAGRRLPRSINHVNNYSIGTHWLNIPPAGHGQCKGKLMVSPCASKFVSTAKIFFSVPPDFKIITISGLSKTNSDKTFWTIHVESVIIIFGPVSRHDSSCNLLRAACISKAVCHQKSSIRLKSSILIKWPINLLFETLYLATRPSWPFGVWHAETLLFTPRDNGGWDYDL
ncbi:hypothetical protein DFH09DRAFT_1080530 [Mycena vulgaris]|nr:hypothetical protein DFH09DRAFT_1080530 [Mycena vulgaris]